MEKIDARTIMVNNMELVLKRGFDRHVLRGSSLIFWYFIVLLFVLVWCSGSVLAAYATIFSQDGREFWFLGIIFPLVSVYLLIKLPSLLWTIVREIFCIYTLNINKEFIEVNWNSSVYSGKKRFNREIFRIVWVGAPLTPVLMVGENLFCFGALFTKENWEEITWALWPETKAEQKH